MSLTAATEHSRTLHHKAAAATEHSRVIEMSASVVCVNIDWMHNTIRTNMDALAKTIKGVVSNMQPTMICMCEVGENTNPLSQRQMQQVADEVISAWIDAATEHIQLRSMFTAGAPCVTTSMAGVTGDICVLSNEAATDHFASISNCRNRSSTHCGAAW